MRREGECFCEETKYLLLGMVGTKTKPGFTISKDMRPRGNKSRVTSTRPERSDRLYQISTKRRRLQQTLHVHPSTTLLANAHQDGRILCPRTSMRLARWTSMLNVLEVWLPAAPYLPMQHEKLHPRQRPEGIISPSREQASSGVITVTSVLRETEKMSQVCGVTTKAEVGDPQPREHETKSKRETSWKCVHVVA